jgi:hypothetical protein
VLVLAHTLARRLHEVKELGLCRLQRILLGLLGLRVQKIIIVSTIMVNLWDIVWLGWLSTKCFSWQFGWLSWRTKL